MGAVKDQCQLNAPVDGLRQVGQEGVEFFGPNGQMEGLFSLFNQFLATFDNVLLGDNAPEHFKDLGPLTKLFKGIPGVLHGAGETVFDAVNERLGVGGGEEPGVRVLAFHLNGCAPAYQPLEAFIDFCPGDTALLGNLVAVGR